VIQKKGENYMRKKFIKGIVIILSCVGIMGLFTGCSSSNDDYKDTLNSGLNKYNNGEKMNKNEYNAVKSYNKWKDKQTDKKYSDWDK
jgi:hypothetical protein